jgi:O-antigen ligase
MIPVYLIVSRLLTPGTIIGLVLAGLVAVPMIPGTFWDRMASITDASRDATGSRSERVELMTLAWDTFLEHPATGIGAGQFQNYQPPGQPARWRVTHNTPLQLAAEVGLGGLALLCYLMFRSFQAAHWTRRTLTAHLRRRRRGPPDPEDGLTAAERDFLREQAIAMMACMAAWLVASQFASVGYNWTFYYLMGLCVTSRNVVRARAAAYARVKAGGAPEVVAA